MKKTILGVVSLFAILGTSFAFASVDVDGSESESGDLKIQTTSLETKTYDTREAFEEAEGETCQSATDGCNTYFMTDGKVAGGTLMYCEDIYGENGQEKWSCLSYKDEETEKPELVGGDRDEHGCIPSAGYSWSELKQECVRPWEEVITLSDNDESLLKTIEEKLSQETKETLNTNIGNYEKLLGKYDKSIQEEVNALIVKKVETIISDFLMNYPQDTVLSEKVTTKYQSLEYLKLKIMKIKF